jgi:hypothetical protein
MTNRRDSAESRDREGTSSGRADSSRGSGSGGRGGRVATLHGAQGNQAVQELASRGAIQPKLTVSDPDDASEREAERVAETVLAADEPAPTAETDVTLQPRGGGGGGMAADDDLEREIQSVTSGGRALPQGTRGYFEERFGRDFGDVRVHTGSRADAAARSIDAEAFAHGTDIVFRSGAYQPGTPAGKQLLAHELTHVVQSGGDGRSVHRSNVSDEERDEAREFSDTVGLMLGGGAFEEALKERIKGVFEEFDFDESEKEGFEEAIREERLADFASQFGDSGFRTSMKKLVTVVRARNVLAQLEEFREEHDAGFEYDEDTIAELRTDVETVQEEIEFMHVLRKQAMASLLGDANAIEVSDKTRTLNRYLRSEAFKSDLERLDPEDRSEFMQERLSALGALAASEVAGQTTREAIGTLFQVESHRKLLTVDQSRRTAAFERVLEGEGDSTFQQVFDAVVGTSGSTAKVAKKLNDGLNDIHGNAVNGQNWISALETLPGRGSVQAKAFVQRLDDAGRLGAFVAMTTMYSMEWPDDVQESIQQSGNVAAIAGSSPDIARVLGMTDEALEVTKFGSALRFLGQWLGPAGDFVTSIADGINAYQEYYEGDIGSGIGSTVSAAGALAGGIMTAGGIITSSTGWTGAGLLVGLGVGLIGAGIGWIWGETDRETKLENMGLIRDTDTDYIPGT